MQVDPRRDHSFHVPRPDLSLNIGTPNACTGCHGDRTDRWAAENVSGWSKSQPPRHFANLLAAGRAEQLEERDEFAHWLPTPPNQPSYERPRSNYCDGSAKRVSM